jgi:hypothetical protein
MRAARLFLPTYESIFDGVRLTVYKAFLAARVSI